MTSRGSRGERPRGSFSGAVAAIMGSIRFHCSFVSSILIVLHIQDVMSSFIFNFFNKLHLHLFIVKLQYVIELPCRLNC